MRNFRYFVSGLLIILIMGCFGCIENKTNVKIDSSNDTLGESIEDSVFRRIWDDVPTLDPHHVSDTTSATIVVELFSGLVTISPDLLVVPDLAESWDISADGITYTFYLRDNAKFQNGRKVTAYDVEYSLERALNPSTMSPTVKNFLGDIVGSDDVMNGITKKISGVKILDEMTISITIDQPKAYFLNKLTYPVSFVVDRNDIEKNDNSWFLNPNGTGPFILDKYVVGEELILRKNPNYYLNLPKLDYVIFKLSGGSALAMYENNEIDITGVGVADLDRISNVDDPLNSEVVVAIPGFDLTYIGFNVSMPPFDDPNIRKALAMSINKQLIASQVLLDLVVPANGILPPNFPGYNLEFNQINPDYEYNLELARELILNSKYSNDVPRIIITVPGMGGSVGLDLQVITQSWIDELLLNVEIEQVEWATFLDDLNARTFQSFAGMGWQADYPDPENFLDVNFHSKSPLNHTGYNNVNVDTLLEDARIKQSWEERKLLYNEAEKIIVQDAPIIPLWHSGENMVLIKPHVKGYLLTPLIIPKLKYVYIEK